MSLDASGPNADQIRYWNETAGPKWVTLQNFIDEQIRPLGLLAMERARIAAGERVLDVGCGCGDTTLEIARRVGPGGRVTGLDLSGPMLARARAAAEAAGLANATFENADAQTAALSRASYDVLYSRFGVMFFADPPAAFANLRAALKPAARLGFVCWRSLPENPWMLVPLMAAAQHVPLPAPPAPDAPGPFAFADQGRVRGILEQAGFDQIEIEPLDEKLAVGAGNDLDATVDFLLQMGPTGNALREGNVDRAAVFGAVREALLPYWSDGLRMDSAAWIVTARPRKA